MAEQRHAVVAYRESIEEVRRLGVSGGNACPPELLDEDRSDTREIEETGDVELQRGSVGRRPDAVWSLFEALALQNSVALGRVVLERVVLIEQALGRVVELLRARLLPWHATRSWQ